jgi:hypothetical protein
MRRAFAIVGLLLLALSAFCISVHLRNSRYLRLATDDIFAQPGDDESRAIALAHFVAVHGAQAVDPDSASLTAKLEHSLPLELSPVTVLKEGFAFPGARRFGACGQLSRTIRAVGWLHGIRSHKVLMGEGKFEHAMVALDVDGGYRLFDPTFDFYWRNAAGHVATVDEVRSDPTIFAQIYERYPNYPYNLSDATYFNWRRLGVPGRWIKRALESVLGTERVANFDTPMLYDRPWWGYTWTTFTLGLACLLAWGAVRRTRRERAPASAPVPNAG